MWVCVKYIFLETSSQSTSTQSLSTNLSRLFVSCVVWLTICCNSSFTLPPEIDRGASRVGESPSKSHSTVSSFFLFSIFFKGSWELLIFVIFNLWGVNLVETLKQLSGHNRVEVREISFLQNISICQRVCLLAYSASSEEQINLMGSSSLVQVFSSGIVHWMPQCLSSNLKSLAKGELISSKICGIPWRWFRCFGQLSNSHVSWRGLRFLKTIKMSPEGIAREMAAGLQAKTRV